MRPTVFQKAELRDENDNIIQQGTYGKGSALSNSTNDAWIDYVMNNLEALYGIAKDEVVPVSALPASGDMNKTYLLTTNGKTYRWSGTAWVELTSSEAVGRAENAADLAEQWATKTNGTVDGSEYSAKYYANSAQQSADDAQDVADDMADHLAQIDQNTGGISANSKRITNIEKLLQGNLYDYQTDSTSAYTKSVPSGAMPYAGIESLGGKTVVWNQNSPTSWVGTKSLTAASAESTYYYINIANASSINPVVGHKYYLRVIASGVTENFYRFLVFYGGGIASSEGATGVISTASNTQNFARLYAYDTNLCTYNITSLMVIDLTLMFGSGNEPTVAEFEAMFPASYYPYNAGTLLSAGVTEVVSKDSNNTTLQTYSIPAEVQALEGYGWSCPDHYNYIDYEAKKYVQEVGSRAYASGDESDSTVITDGTTTYYPLNPAIETDISAYLTDDNLINVEAGGTLTFENQHGDDYQIPVPSDETYMIDLQEALS